MIFGIDYASHQGWIDFAQLKREGHDFAITKVTGENNYVNPYWQGNEANARKAGLIVGTYDWVEPQSPMSGAEAAQDYLRVLGQRQATDLLTVDFETPDWASGQRGRDIEGFMREYLYTLKELSGQPVIVYTAPYFLQETGAVAWDWLGQDFHYWLAAPGGATGTDDMLTDGHAWPGPLGPPFRRVVLHQHQWYARSSAIGSGANFDRDRFDGTRAELAAYGKPAAITQAEVIKGSLGKIEPKREEDTVIEPPAGKYTAYINERGETIVCLNFGGDTKRIDGVNIVDIGVSVESATAPGQIVDRSFQHQEAQLWRERS